MKKSFKALYIGLGALLVLQGCSDLGDTPITEETLIDLVADYSTWDILSTDHVDSLVLGTAHLAGDPDYQRVIYGEVTTTGAGIAEGSILVKETFKMVNGEKVWPDQLGLLAMVKRESGFAASSGDWEFVMLDNGAESVMASGADLGGGICASCHAGAADAGGRDFVFSVPAAAAQSVSFSQDVQPVLGACLGCHGSSGGLNLSSYDNLMAGGNSGSVVNAGDPQNSLLYRRLLGQGGALMPLGGPALPQSQRDIIRDWIQEGALNN